MNSIEVFDHIERIAATSSKLEKEALVAEKLDDYLFRQVIIAAYDPFKVYFVANKTMAQIEESIGIVFNHESGHKFDGETWALLEGLENRTFTGHEAVGRIALGFSRLDGKSAELLKRILLKDLRAGFSDSTVNKVAPGTLPSFPYMRCTLPDKSNMDKWDWSRGIFSQEKADGMFANSNVYSSGFVSITSRQGTPLPSTEFARIQHDLLLLKNDRQYHGELVIYSYGEPLAREVSNGMLNHIADGGSVEPGCEIRFYIWDSIPIAKAVRKGKDETPYSQRFVEIVESVGRLPKDSPVRVVPTRVVHSKVEAYGHYRELLKMGKEGTVVKHPDLIWKDTNGSKDQVKLKLEVTVELEVTGFNEGSGKYEGQLGSFQCKSADGLLRVDVSGRGDAQRAEVWANKLDWLGEVISVKANSIMTPDKEGDPYSLFLPIFVEKRRDKREADTLEEIQNQFRMAIE